MAHFGTKEQAKLLRRCEKCYKYATVYSTLERQRRISNLKNRQMHSVAQRNAYSTLER